MTVSEASELNGIIAAAFEGQFGNRATHRELYQAVIGDVPGHLVRYFADAAIRSKVSAFLNRRDAATGLPFAPVANAEGQHVQVELMGYKDLEYLATQYIRKSDPLVAQARKVADLAFERYGQTIKVDGIDLRATERRGEVA